jgi:hypothetical protein
MADRHAQPAASLGPGQSDPPDLLTRACAALLTRLAVAPVLTPTQLAATVAATLPPRLGRWLLRRLAAHGWLRSAAIVPFDILDGPACPPEFRGPLHAVVRLAIFGPPGQGLPWRDKHRMDVYQQLCAEIMREAVDSYSLQAASQRALNHPDVCADALLSSMMRAFVAERAAALRDARTTPTQEYDEVSHASKLTRGFMSRNLSDFPTRDEVLDNFSRLHREYDGYLAQFEETRAQRVLAKMRDLRQRFPVHVSAAELQTCEEQYDNLLKRAGVYRRQIEELAARGGLAAIQGDGKTASWVVRRLEAIHALLPVLLPATRLQTLRSDIERSGQKHETDEAVLALRRRKQDVVTKIKELAGIIHHYHETTARLPAEHNAVRRAELNYRHALDELRAMNTEWLTGLVLELETLLEDLDDTTGQAQTQLDMFIANVRTALNRLCLEVRAHQRKQHTPAADPQAGPPPTTA